MDLQYDCQAAFAARAVKAPVTEFLPGRGTQEQSRAMSNLVSLAAGIVEEFAVPHEERSAYVSNASVPMSVTANNITNTSWA